MQPRPVVSRTQTCRPLDGDEGEAPRLELVEYRRVFPEG